MSQDKTTINLLLSLQVNDEFGIGDAGDAPDALMLDPEDESDALLGQVVLHIAVYLFLDKHQIGLDLADDVNELLNVLLLIPLHKQVIEAGQAGILSSVNVLQ